MSNKKRKITLTKNNLDAISRWYFSKMKFGDAYGNRITSPLGTTDIAGQQVAVDSRLYISPTRDAGLNGGEPHVQWSLAAANENGQPVEPNIGMLREFVEAALADDAGRFLEFQQENNQFIFTQKAIGTQGERYSSFAAEMLESLISTANKSLEQIADLDSETSQVLAQESARNVNGNLLVSRNYTSFDRAMRESEILFNGDSFGAFYNSTFTVVLEAIRAGQAQEFTLAQLVASIYTIVNVLGNTERNKNLINYFLFTEVQKVLDEEQTRVLMMADNTYGKRHHYVEIETPYVTTKNSANFLEEISTGEPYRAAVKGDYSYFIRSFEENTISDELVENLLPNNYVRYYFKKLLLKRTAGELPPEEERKYQEFKIILGLSGEIKDENLSGIYESLYFNSYGLEVTDLNLDNQVIRNIITRNNSTIIDSTQLSEFGLNVGTPPMEVKVEFTRDRIGDSIDLITGQNSERLTDASSIIFENIKLKDEDFRRGVNLYSTEYLRNQNNFIIERESPFSVVQLREFPIQTLLTRFLRFPEFSSLVVNTTTADIPRSPFLYSMGLMGIANRNSRNSYGLIVSGQDSRSEALGYRIRKTLPNSAIQDFYIGNGRGSKVVTYKDSQIKYGSDYKYTLTEYRLIYGTKYKFRVKSTNLPMWIMENYLGFSSNAEEKLREIETSRVQQFGQEYNPLPVPNLKFEAYVQEAADPIITEVPVYDEAFNLQSIFPNLPDNESSNLISSEIGGQGGISYPMVKVLDRPPTAPGLEIFPMVGVKDQIKLLINLQTGNNTGENAREIVSIGDRTDKILELKRYQDTYVNRFLPPNKLEYKNEGLSELRSVTVYRTTQIDLEVDTYNDIYKSFDPNINPSVFVRKITNKNLNQEEFSDIQKVSSYDLRDTIQPNVNYYYTCVVEDFHDNPSNPSIIYRVRLVYDKGLLIPEIDTVSPTGQGQTKPQKDLAQFIKIDASNIQTLPYVNTDNGGFETERSLGYSLGKSIEDQSYIVRLTSKDTGRKFDIKLNFVVNVNGSPINEGT